MSLRRCLVAAVSLAMSFLGGCAMAKHDPIVIDYSVMPASFIRKIEFEQPYILRRGGQDIQLYAEAEKGSNGKLFIKFGDKQYDRSSLRPANNVPYFVYTGGKEFLILYEAYNKSKDGADDFRGQMRYYRLSEKNGISNSDNAMLRLVEEPTDPENIKVYVHRNILGNACSLETYRVNENGHLKPKKERGKYVYPIKYFVDKPLYSQEEAEVEVFKDANTAESTVELLPKYTKFKRLRATEGYNQLYYTDLQLEDGRVARFQEFYLFSEPSALLSVRDKRNKWINFYGVSGTGRIEDIPKETLEKLH